MFHWNDQFHSTGIHLVCHRFHWCTYHHCGLLKRLSCCISKMFHWNDQFHSTWFILCVTCFTGVTITTVVYLIVMKIQWALFVIIIIKRSSIVPVYHTRWECRALFSTTSNTHTHARTCTHTHTLLQTSYFKTKLCLKQKIQMSPLHPFLVLLAFQFKDIWRRSPFDGSSVFIVQGCHCMLLYFIKEDHKQRHKLA